MAEKNKLLVGIISSMIGYNAINVDPDTLEAIEDWDCWVARGYEF
jgi:hypothetical protein